MYYERRSKQYDLSDDVDKTRLVTLTGQTLSYISVFLNEPHSTHRYYGELLEAYKHRIYLDDDYPEPYYLSAYLFSKISIYMRNNIISKKYKNYKYHLACAVRGLLTGRDFLNGNSKKMKSHCDKLQQALYDDERLLRTVDVAVGCLDSAILSVSNIPKNQLHRSKELTNSLLDKVDKHTENRNDGEYLQVGNVLQGIVSGVRDYYILVTLKTEDERDYGSIHISKIADRYISNINDEFSVNDVITVKIVKDTFSTSRFGWELSAII